MWRGVAAVVLAAVVAATLYSQRGLVGSALRAIGRITWAQSAVLAALWAAWTLARIALHRQSIDGLRWRHAVVLAEAHEGARNLPGGTMMGIAGRMAIGRRLGHSRPVMVVAIIAVSASLAIALWVSVAATAAARLITGGSAVDVAALVAAIFGIGVLGLLVVVLVRRTPTTERLLGLAERFQAVVGRRIPRVAAFNLQRAAEAGRTHLGDLMRRRGAGMLGAAVVTHLLSGSILWAALRFLDARIGTLAFWAAYTAVTAAVGLAPTPGGIGFAEGGMAVALTSAGVDSDIALAGALLHRVVVFIVPTLTGSVLYGLWLGRSSLFEDEPV